MQIMRRLALIFIMIGLVIGAIVYILGYHDVRNFGSKLSRLPEVDEVVSKARRLSGTPYDPLMGGYGNIGARAGFVVCSDVPNIAYGLAGYSLQAVLEEDFKVHPGAYNASNGNRPGNPYFHRRARNLYSYFKGNGRLAPSSALPEIGDLAFYRHDPKSYISHVALVTRVEGDKYWVMESAPETILAKEVDGGSPVSRGWSLVGFGRMYQNDI